LERDNFKFIYDAMHGVAGPYAKAIFKDELGVPEDCLKNCTPLEVIRTRILHMLMTWSKPVDSMAKEKSLMKLQMCQIWVLRLMAMPTEI